MRPEVTLAVQTVAVAGRRNKEETMNMDAAAGLALRLSVVKNFSLFFPVTLTYDTNVDPTLKLIQPLRVKRRRVAQVSANTTFTWVPCVFCRPCWAQLI